MWTAIRNNLIVGLLALGLAGPAGAAVLEPFKATYKASHGIIGLGEATFKLNRSGDCWRWHGVANPSGLAAMLIGRITDDSEFCLADDGTVMPQRFQHEEQGDAEDSYRLDFNWDEGTVEYNSGEPFPVSKGAVDPFLIQIAARLWLERADTPLKLDAREFTVVDENEIKQYRLAVSEGPRIETGSGTFKTIRVARVDDSDKQLIFWTAPELDYLPVKVEHREDGKTRIRFLLRSMNKKPSQGEV